MRKKNREVKDLESIISIIDRCDVCRIALTENNVPYIITMNFGYSGKPPEKIWFHCAKEGRKIEMIEKQNFTCFEMDTDHELRKGEAACDFSMNYSSIVGYGHIEIIEDPDIKAEGLNAVMEHYTGRNDFSFDPVVLSNTAILCLKVTELTAKRLHKTNTGNN